MPHRVDDPKPWRKLAADARKLAKSMADPNARNLVMAVADGYDRVAEIAEKRARAKESK